jgi:hypothetical protein
MASMPMLPGTPAVPLPLEAAGSAGDERKPTNAPALVSDHFTHRLPCGIRAAPGPTSTYL